MNFSDLLIDIAPLCVADTLTVSAELNVCVLAPLRAGESQNEPDTLYYGPIDIVDPANPPAALLYTGTASQSLLPRLTNAVQIQEGLMSEACHQINNRFALLLKTAQTHAQLLNMLLSGSALGEIMNSIHEKSQAALVAIDITGKVISYSTPFVLKDEIWQPSIERGYCTSDFMDDIKAYSRHLKTDCPEDSRAFNFHCTRYGYYYLCSKIIVENELMGYTFMINQTGTFGLECHELLPLTSQIAAKTIMRGGAFINPLRHVYNNIFADMINGMDLNSLRSRIKAAQIHLPHSMQLVQIAPYFYSGEYYLDKKLSEMVNQMFPDTPFFRYRNSIVILIPSADKDTQLSPEQTSKFEKLAEKEHLNICVSNIFSDPTAFKQHFDDTNRTLAIIRMLRLSGHIHYYRNVAFWDLLSHLPDYPKISGYCHPCLEQLKAYDEANQTSLYETLRVYTETDFNQNEAAKILYLHRNTLSCRRRRISELCHIDLDDPQVRFHLVISFKINLFIERRT